MCFSLAWLENLLIQLIVLAAAIALIKLLLVPYVLTPMGANEAVAARAVDIIVWCLVAVFVVILIFGLLRCVVFSPIVR